MALEAMLQGAAGAYRDTVLLNAAAQLFLKAGTNAIQHGHRKDASKPLDVEFRVHPTVLEIAVHDMGTGFNPDDVNGDVTTPDHILDQRGRGLFIMRSCMDRVEFSFDRDGTLCRLFKNRPRKADNP